MKKLTLWGLLLIAVVAGGVIAADHLDAPAVAMEPTDIADFYAFEGENAASTVFIVTVPAADNSSNFSENVMFEINIDNTGVDMGTTGVTEDLVIQCLRQGNRMYFFGPYAPNSTGLSNTIDENAFVGSVAIGGAGEDLNNGIQAFAGHRRDAFFFDFVAFNDVVMQSTTSRGFGEDGDNDL